MQKCKNKNAKMQNAKMQKCKNAKMQKCKNAKMQKCKNAKMQNAKCKMQNTKFILPIPIDF
jgi:hypothetical protein